MAQAMTVDECWPLIWAWNDLRRGTTFRSLSADERVRSAVARLLQVEDVKALDAEVTIHTWLDGLEIKGQLRATVSRICGVSLEPFDQQIEQSLSVRIVPAGSENCWTWDGGDDVQIDLDGDDPPDVLVGDSVNVGAVLVEQLSLALPPFPRKPDAVFVGGVEHKVSVALCSVRTIEGPFVGHITL